MIKLFIVDDEIYIRHGIQYAADWTSFNIEVVGESSDGEDALEKIRLLHPDIVICDIVMPKLNGLVLASKLREILPNIRIVLMTGYSNTEYLLEAIRFGIRDYLLKPTGKEQLLQTVLRIRDELVQEKLKYERVLKNENLLSKNAFLIRSAILDAFLRNTCRKDSFIKNAVENDICLGKPPYYLIMGCAQNGGEWQAIHSIQSIFPQFLSANGAVTGTSNFFILFSTSGGTIQPEQMMKAATVAESYLKRDTRLIFSSSVLDLAHLPNTYQLMIHALEGSWWDDANHYLLIDHSTEVPSEQKLLQQEALVLSVACSSFDHELLLYEIQRYLVELHNCRLAKSKTRFLLIAFIFRLHYILYKASPDTNQLYKLNISASLDEQMDAIIQHCNLNFKNNKLSVLVGNAKQFIASNYNQRITLNDVSNAVFVSKGYLCRLFYKETGTGVNEYINFCRIEEAKRLLRESDIHHYEVASKIGYSNYKIFSHYFRLFAGCTASEYRLQHFSQEKTKK